jgi:hypothetical protein
MRNFIFVTFIFTSLISLSSKAIGQANLTIENNSKRTMTIKVMKGSGSGSLFKTVTIGPYGRQTVYFEESGYYFTKSRAVLSGKDPVYQKGQPFQVVNNSSGYSVLTLTFTIKESTIPQASGGVQISKSEFEKN